MHQLLLQEVEVNDEDIIKQLMEHSNANRSTGSTGANSESSRSHSIMQVQHRCTLLAMHYAGDRLSNHSSECMPVPACCCQGQQELQSGHSRSILATGDAARANTTYGAED